MTKINTPTVGGPVGGNYPVPSYFGFKWQKIEKHVAEMGYLRQKSRQNAQRIQELRDELEFQRNRLEDERAVAERQGKDEPSGQYVLLTQQQIEKHEAKEKSLRRAAEMVEKDLREAVLDKGAEYLEQVDARARKDVERYAEVVAEAERLKSDLGAMVGLKEVLTGEKDAKHFGVYPPDNMAWDYTPDEGLVERVGG
jgi:chromosome segregation ATPase